MQFLGKGMGSWHRQRPLESGARSDWRSVFIVPTVTGVAFGGALLLMLLVAINYQNSLAYGLCFWFAALFGVSLVHTWRNMLGLSLQCLPSPAVFAGESAYFYLRVQEAGRAREALSARWLGFPPADAETATDGLFRLCCPALQRGWLAAAPVRLESRFPLGIWVAWTFIQPQGRVLVYPTPLACDLPYAAEAETGTPMAQAGMGDYQGMRPWQPGESMRRLDWKAYSRGRGRLVRDFVALAPAEGILDFEALRGDTEQRLSYLCYEVLRQSRLGQRFCLRLPGQTLGPDSGPVHSERCLRALALFGQESNEC